MGRIRAIPESGVVRPAVLARWHSTPRTGLCAPSWHTRWALRVVAAAADHTHAVTMSTRHLRTNNPMPNPAPQVRPWYTTLVVDPPTAPKTRICHRIRPLGARERSEESPDLVPRL